MIVISLKVLVSDFYSPSSFVFYKFHFLLSNLRRKIRRWKFWSTARWKRYPVRHSFRLFLFIWFRCQFRWSAPDLKCLLVGSYYLVLQSINSILDVGNVSCFTFLISFVVHLSKIYLYTHIYYLQTDLWLMQDQIPTEVNSSFVLLILHGWMVNILCSGRL